jgi:hypothetical protein
MRRIVTLLATGILCLISPLAWPGQPPANVPAAISAADASRLSYTDVFIGRNTRGPYLLSWKGVLSRSERVVVDGRPLTRGEEYTIDYTAGTLTFTRPLRNGSMAQVTYEVDARTAQRNPQTLQLPLEMELLNAARGKLALTGAYSASLDKPGKETTLLGLTGELLPAGSTQISATFLTDPNARGGMDDKSGLRLQATTRSDLAEWTLSYLRTGREFSGAQAWKVKPDTDAFSTALKMMLSQRVSLSLGYQQSEVGSARAEGTSATLAYNPAQGIRAVLSYLNQENPLATVTTTSAAVNLQRGALTAGIERRTQEQQSLLQGRTEATTDRLTAQVNLTPNTQAHALLEQQRLEGAQGATERATASLGVTTSPKQGVQLRTGIRYDEIGEKQQTELSLGLEARPSSTYRLLGGYLQREGELGDRTTSTNVRMVATPSALLQVETGAVLETRGQQASLKQDILLAMQPWQGIRLETGLQGLYAGEREGYLRTLRAQVAPNRTWRLEATHRLRLQEGAVPPETWGLALNVNPSPALSLTGTYTRNPEDHKGHIKQQEQADVKLQAQMAALTLHGSLGIRRDLLNSTNITLADVSLIYRFSPLMELLTGYRLSRQQTTSELAAYTYRLGYRYALSDVLNVSLEGMMTTYQRDRIFQPNQTEYEARLKLGVKF